MLTLASKMDWDHPLRLLAEERLRGAHVEGVPRASGMQALVELVRLAGAPDAGGELMQLFHEVQLHLVVLELQQEQAEIDYLDLRDRMSRYRAYFESAPFGCMALDGAGRVIEANKAAAQRLGFSRQDCIGRFFEDMFLPDSRACLRDLISGVLRGDAPLHAQADGRLIHVKLVSAKMPTPVMLAFVA